MLPAAATPLSPIQNGTVVVRMEKKTRAQLISELQAQPKPIPDRSETERGAPGAPARIDELTSFVIESATVLGGFGAFPMAIGDAVAIDFDGLNMCLTTKGAQHVMSIAVEDFLAVAVYGPGEVTSNAGVVGGGFGVDAAISGMAMAALFNTITERSTTNTFVHFDCTFGELYLHTSVASPEALEMVMAPLCWRVRHRSQ